jgi:hypothetical protein
MDRLIIIAISCALKAVFGKPVFGKGIWQCGLGQDLRCRQ